MKWLLILITLFFAAIPCKSQDNEFQIVDNLALHIPLEQTHSTADIAAFIQKHFDTDIKRVRAAYVWVTTNIKYDKVNIHRVILDEDREEKVTYALQRRKGVCENFAAIFNDICNKSGIRSYVIEGLTKQNGAIEKSPHVWCAARIENNWFFFDPTWDAQFINYGQITGQRKSNYLKISPADFIQTHIPYDPLFQLLNYPVSYNGFNNFNSIVNNNKPFFDYVDSINAYEKMDSLSRYLSAASRIENYGWPTSLIDIKLKQIKLEIELLYQDTDMDLYNSIVEDYNEAIIIFNDFINYRNNQFQPAKSNTEVQSMFNNIKNKITVATIKINKVNRSKATLALDTGDVQKKLNDLALHVKDQESFLESYLSAQKEK